MDVEKSIRKHKKKSVRDFFEGRYIYINLYFYTHFLQTRKYNYLTQTIPYSLHTHNLIWNQLQLLFIYNQSNCLLTNTLWNYKQRLEISQVRKQTNTKLLLSQQQQTKCNYQQTFNTDYQQPLDTDYSQTWTHTQTPNKHEQTQHTTTKRPQTQQTRLREFPGKPPCSRNFFRPFWKFWV